MPNVTHAAALTAMRRGTFERAVAPARVEWKAFNAGPQVVEAIFADAVDVAYIGPGPAENGYLRSRGEALVVLAGAASGGAGLVVRRGADIHGPADLHRKRLASPQLGNTQDVALRTWLDKNGLRSNDRGGDVYVYPMNNSEILTLMRRGELDGAWVPEPWTARLQLEADGVLLVDERTLWPDGRFPSALLVAARASLGPKHDAIARLLRAHVDEVAWIDAHPTETRSLLREQLTRLSGKALPQQLVDRAMDSVAATWDPMPAALERLAADARRLRYLPEGDLSRLVDRSLLDAAVAARAAQGAP